MAAGLIMATAMVPVAMVFLGYILGSGRIPWKSLAATLLVISVLHPGKYAMRESYWGGGGVTSVLNLPAYYSEWFGYGLEELGGVAGVFAGPKEESEATSVFERAGNIHMLLRVQKMSPAEVPFLNGLTYEAIPSLLVPRFIHTDKGLAHAGNILLTVNYGVQSMEQATGGTSIAWGLVAEAFANFGYIGVAALAVFLAAFYAFFSRMSVSVPLTSLRFVVGLLVMGAAVKADTMALFITSQFQAIVGVSVAAIFLMRRQANPFAAANDSVVTSGMPAPGILAELIEGAPEGRGDEGTKGLRDEEFPNSKGLRVGGRLAADGGAVRTMPIRVPKRIASWMPRRVRAAVVAAARSAEERGDGGQGTGEAQNGSGVTRERPRQVAVPYQNYRRYRG
jgi:hypothetical protein